jgi:hypothetical protein
MKSEAENLTALDSLKIISEMIEQAKGNAQKDSFYYLFWGWTIVLINIGIYCLIKFTDISNPYMMWLLTIPAWIVTFLYGYQKRKTTTTRGHLDYIRMWFWIGFGVTILLLIIFAARINFQLNGVILLIAAIPTIASGAMIKFKPLMIGGALFWIFGSICFIVSYETQLLLSAAGIISGYLIPGYWLKKIQ